MCGSRLRPSCAALWTWPAILSVAKDHISLGTAFCPLLLIMAISWVFLPSSLTPCPLPPGFSVNCSTNTHAPSPLPMLQTTLECLGGKKVEASTQSPACDQLRPRQHYQARGSGMLHPLPPVCQMWFP